MIYRLAEKNNRVYQTVQPLNAWLVNFSVKDGVVNILGLWAMWSLLQPLHSAIAV